METVGPPVRRCSLPALWRLSIWKFYVISGGGYFRLSLGKGISLGRETMISVEINNSAVPVVMMSLICELVYPIMINFASKRITTLRLRLIWFDAWLSRIGSKKWRSIQLQTIHQQVDRRESRMTTLIMIRVAVMLRSVKSLETVVELLMLWSITGVVYLTWLVRSAREPCDSSSGGKIWFPWLGVLFCIRPQILAPKWHSKRWESSKTSVPSRRKLHYFPCDGLRLWMLLKSRCHLSVFIFKGRPAASVIL